MIVGKSIPVQDFTYLAGLKKSILEKVRKIYPKYLSLVSYENGKTAIQNMDEKIETLTQIIGQQQKQIEEYKMELAKRIEDLRQELFIEKGLPVKEKKQ